LAPPKGAAAHARRLVDELPATAVDGPLQPVWSWVWSLVGSGKDVTPATLAARMANDEWPYARLVGIVGEARRQFEGVDPGLFATEVSSRLLELHHRRQLQGQIYNAWLAITAEGVDAAAPFLAAIEDLGRATGALADLPILGELADRAFAQVDQAVKARHEGRAPELIPTGFRTLDRLTAGFERGELWLVAGQTSKGKTSWAMQVARTVAGTLFEGANGPERGVVEVVSVEMRDLQIARKALSGLGRVPKARMRTGDVDEVEMARLGRAFSKLASLRIYVDSDSRTPIQIRSRARALKARARRLDLLVVDYLQLLSGDGRFTDRRSELDHISHALKGLAMDLNVPVLALAQFSRKVEGKYEPSLSDLRESGALEQDADVVVFLWDDPDVDPSRAAPKKPHDLQHRQIIVAKAREGPVFRFGALWDPITQEFTDDAELEAAAAAPKRRPPRERADSEPDSDPPGGDDDAGEPPPGAERGADAADPPQERA